MRRKSYSKRGFPYREEIHIGRETRRKLLDFMCYARKQLVSELIGKANARAEAYVEQPVVSPVWATYETANPMADMIAMRDRIRSGT